MRRFDIPLGLGIAVIAIACVDDIPTSTPPEPIVVQPEPQQTQTEQQVANAPLRSNIYTYRNVRHFADAMIQTLAEERIWCDHQPEVAELRAMLDDHEAEDIWRDLLLPARGEDLRSVQIVAEATAEARGIPMQQLPPVALISRTNLRHYACLTQEIWEDPTDEDNVWTVG